MLSSPENLIKKTALIWLPHQSFYADLGISGVAGAGMREKRSLTRLTTVVVTQQRCNLPMTISLGAGSKKRGMDVTISLHNKITDIPTTLRPDLIWCVSFEGSSEALETAHLQKLKIIAILQTSCTS